jgi:hypothetical protein
MIIYLYFVPDQAYEMKITGKYKLQELELYDFMVKVIRNH